MNFELTDEQIFLQEAARGALARHKTVENAREVLEGGDPLDLWPLACEAGWPGLLVPEEQGGAGLGALEAMLVLAETGRVLAGVPLIGHVPATYVLAGSGQDELLAALAGGERRAAFVPAMPPGDLDAGWTVDPLRGKARPDAPVLDGGALRGEASWVPDAPGADVLVVAAVDGAGAPVAVLVEAGADGVAVEPAASYDPARPLGHVRFDGAQGTALPGGEERLAAAWHLAQGLLAAEALGIVEECLRRGVEYSKERFTFGRPIGSYQAIKHLLVEILRQQENLRSLLYYAGWAGRHAPEEFVLAASAARVAGGKAVNHATRGFINVSGGIGATWEHDAPLYFRRAQLSNRLLGGPAAAADRVAGELLEAAAA